MKINNIIKIPFILAFIIGALYTAGCGASASSAPPVDLPAPITGRVDVSAPDANGNVTITGVEGAVPAGTTVVAINDSVATSATLKFLDRLVANAYAQELGLPVICSDLGYACTVAGTDGSFVLVIAASEGDIIRLGLIDPTSGAFISEFIQILVPSSGTPLPQANCAGQGVSGSVVDVKIAPTLGVPILLKQGSDTSTNELVIGLSTPVTIPITGCFAHSLALFKSATADAIAVTSKDDKILWTAKLASGAVSGARSFTLAKEPMHTMFVDSRTSLLVALKTVDTVELASISLGTGEVLATMSPQVVGGTTITGLTRSTDLDIKAMEQGVYQNNYVGMLIADNGSGAGAYVTIFVPQTLSHKGSWGIAEINSANANAPIDTIDAGALFISAAGQNVMRFSVLGNSSVLGSIEETYNIQVSPTIPLFFTGSIDGLTSLLSPPLHVKFNRCVNETLRNIAISQNIETGKISPAISLITTTSGSLCLDQLETDNPPAPVAPVWTSGDDIVAIAVDTVTKQIFGADNTIGAALNGSSYYTW